MSDGDSTRVDPYVYFVQFGDSGPIKIGKTTRQPEHRLKSLQTGSPVQLHLLATITSPDKAFSEKSIHRRFRHLRILGEWFKAAPDLTSFIDEYGQPYSPEFLSADQANAAFDSELELQSLIDNLNNQPGRQRWKPRPHVKTLRQKKKLWRWIYLVNSGSASTSDAATAFKVTAQTIRRWMKEVLDSNDVDSEGLRRLVLAVKAESTP